MALDQRAESEKLGSPTIFFMIITILAMLLTTLPATPAYLLFASEAIIWIYAILVALGYIIINILAASMAGLLIPLYKKKWASSDEKSKIIIIVEAMSWIEGYKRKQSTPLNILYTSLIFIVALYSGYYIVAILEIGSEAALDIAHRVYRRLKGITLNWRPDDEKRSQEEA